MVKFIIYINGGYLIFVRLRWGWIVFIIYFEYIFLCVGIL